MPASPRVTIAVYTGMFDPIHLGHMDIIERASRVFSRVVVGVGVNPEKSPLFSIDERVRMIREVVSNYSNVEVQPFAGLAVHFVKQSRASMMIRGLRTVSDMEFEFSMSLMNQTLDPTIETMFLLAKAEYSGLSSTLIRQIASLGGDLNRFLPASVVPLVEARARDRRRPGEMPHEPPGPGDK